MYNVFQHRASTPVEITFVLPNLSVVDQTMAARFAPLDAEFRLEDSAMFQTLCQKLGASPGDVIWFFNARRTGDNAISCHVCSYRDSRQATVIHGALSHMVEPVSSLVTKEVKAIVQSYITPKVDEVQRILKEAESRYTAYADLVGKVEENKEGVLQQVTDALASAISAKDGLCDVVVKSCDDVQKKVDHAQKQLEEVLAHVREERDALQKPVVRPVKRVRVEVEAADDCTFDEVLKLLGCLKNVSVEQRDVFLTCYSSMDPKMREFYSENILSGKWAAEFSTYLNVILGT